MAKACVARLEVVLALAGNWREPDQSFSGGFSEQQHRRQNQKDWKGGSSESGGEGGRGGLFQGGNIACDETSFYLSDRTEEHAKEASGGRGAGSRSDGWKGNVSSSRVLDYGMG